MEPQDTIVIGAGPAGLTAAIYLGRFRRHCVVLEDGRSRAQWIPTSRNIPGFPAGVGGEEFLDSLRAQALQYGARIKRAKVTNMSLTDGMFHLQTTSGSYDSRYVLLATGVRDHLPLIQGASEAVLRSLLRFCPICDAFEAIDKRIAVIGDGPLGEREAEFLSTYSDQITLLHLGSQQSASDLERSHLKNIEKIAINLSDLSIEENQVVLNAPGGGRRFDVLYLALGCSPQHDLARSLGACCDEHGALTVNAHQETSVPALHAAGDVVRGLNQVVVAAAESAIAATDIHNRLRKKLSPVGSR